jgi:hypothetical protein
MYSRMNPALREIRLLYLHPGTWNDAITCDLYKVSLDDQPCFKAISYVWGNPHQTNLITVNGQFFAVTRNLFGGLQRMRKTEIGLTLWADAVCINQDNLDERYQQVQLMGDIYSSAEEVLVWLGYGEKAQVPRQQPKVYHWTGTAADMSLVNAYFEEVKLLEEENIGTEDILGTFVLLSLLAANRHLHEMDFFEIETGRLQALKTWQSVIHALKNLCSVLWWTRIWVFQEVVLARRVVVLYDYMTAPWDMLERAVACSDSHIRSCCLELFETRPEEERVIVVGFAWRLHACVEGRKTFRNQNGRLSLFQAVNLTLGRNATDVRDKLYGLVGLISNGYEEVLLLPNYSLSPKEVFIWASLIELEKANSLRGLMGTTRKDVPDVPSWVTQIFVSETYRGLEETRCFHAELFRAAGLTRASVEREGDILTVHALQPVDRIASVGMIMGEDNLKSWGGLFHVLKTWRQMASLVCGEVYSHGGTQSWSDAFWRTVVNDYIQMETLDGLAKYSTNINSRTFRTFRDTDLPHLPENWWSWETDLMIGHHAVLPFQEPLMAATCLRKFFITIGGRMGLGSPSILPGDEILLLLGGNTPFAIRNCTNDINNPKTLIGDVYVHGLMYGEGLPEDWEEKVVKIRLQ